MTPTALEASPRRRVKLITIPDVTAKAVADSVNVWPCNLDMFGEVFPHCDTDAMTSNLLYFEQDTMCTVEAYPDCKAKAVVILCQYLAIWESPRIPNIAYHFLHGRHWQPFRNGNVVTNGDTHDVAALTIV